MAINMMNTMMWIKGFVRFTNIAPLSLSYEKGGQDMLHQIITALKKKLASQLLFDTNDVIDIHYERDFSRFFFSSFKTAFRERFTRP